MGEIIQKLKGLEALFNEKFDGNEKYHDTLNNGLAQIKTEAVKTNSRVNKLEIWKARIVGGLTVLNLFLVPMVIYVLIELLKLKFK